MLDQMFESFQRATQSSLQLQSAMFKQWAQQWPTLPLNAAGTSAEWFQTLQKRWIEFLTDSLNKQRESYDSLHKAGIQLMEQTYHLSEAKTPDEYRRMAEELGRKVLTLYKDQSESQLRDFQKGVEKWLEMLPKANA
jgi:hypothetical protein